MRKPPEKPTSLRPQGTRIPLPKPTLIIDSMEQKPYSFKAFRKWFVAIERRKLPAGDYSIAGLEDRVAVERKSLQDLFNCCSPYHSREAFVRACERLSKLDFAAAEAKFLGSLIWNGRSQGGVCRSPCVE